MKTISNLFHNSIFIWWCVSILTIGVAAFTFLFIDAKITAKKIDAYNKAASRIHIGKDAVSLAFFEAPSKTEAHHIKKERL